MLNITLKKGKLKKLKKQTILVIPAQNVKKILQVYSIIVITLIKNMKELIIDISVWLALKIIIV